MASLPFQLFPSVVIPEEVREELFVQESPDQTHLAQPLKSARIHPRQNKPDRLLHAELDSGEAAVIAAALSLGHPTVILDERKARRIASPIYGLQVKGSSGLLVEAKARGIIENVRPFLDGMIHGGYHIGPNLYAACLSAARER
jgi:predicted nucleic acid-binding protein